MMMISRIAQRRPRAILSRIKCRPSLPDLSGARSSTGTQPLHFESSSIREISSYSPNNNDNDDPTDSSMIPQRSFPSSNTPSSPVPPGLPTTRPTKIRPSFFHSNSLPITKREYHTTSRREILPLIGIGIVAIGGMYSFRALRRMDDEWKEYQVALKEYRLENGLAEDDHDGGDGGTEATGGRKTEGSQTVLFRGGTVAFDLGTVNIRVGHLPSPSSSSSSSSGGSPQPTVVVDREGGRSTPNCIVINADDDGSDLIGNIAAAKIFDRMTGGGRVNPVLFPSDVLRNNNHDDEGDGERAVRSVVSSAARNALDQVLGSAKKTTSGDTLFAIDTGLSGGYNVRPVFTYPPPPTTTNGSAANDDEEEEWGYLARYQTALQSMSAPSGIAHFLPESVCAVAGARFYNLLPTSTSGPVLVIDIGGKDTYLSIVQEGSSGSSSSSKGILYHSRLHGLGGETVVETLMDYLSLSFYGRSFRDVEDGSGVQRLYDACRSAVVEMGGGGGGSGGGRRGSSGPSRIQVNIPYLSVDEHMKPLHLDQGVSGDVLNAEINSTVASRIIPSYNEDGGNNTTILSSSVPPPKDLSTLFTSAIMSSLEQSGINNPFALSAILLVGGGARNGSMREAVEVAVGNMAGEGFVEERLVVPEGGMVEELVVLGAAVLGDKE